MNTPPVKELTFCSVNNCYSETKVIVQKRYGEQKVTYGLCDFHSIISATLFSKKDKLEFRI